MTTTSGLTGVLRGPGGSAAHFISWVQIKPVEDGEPIDVLIRLAAKEDPAAIQETFNKADKLEILDQIHSVRILGIASEFPLKDEVIRLEQRKRTKQSDLDDAAAKALYESLKKRFEG